MYCCTQPLLASRLSLLAVLYLVVCSCAQLLDENSVSAPAFEEPLSVSPQSTESPSYSYHQRLDKTPDENVKSSTQRVEFYDDRSLLDTFGEAAKQYLTQKVIPPTDEECKWDWRVVRCEPYCDCHLNPQPGDYHLGRACRLVEKQTDCDPSSEAFNSVQLLIQRVIRGTRRALSSVRRITKQKYEAIQDKVCEGMEVKQCSPQGEMPIIAWQEKLFCGEMIPTCTGAIGATSETTSSPQHVEIEQASTSEHRFDQIRHHES